MNHYILALICTIIGLPCSGATNPFAQPTSSELKIAVETMRADSRFPQRARLISASLSEPSKRLYYDATNTAPLPREIRTTVFDASSNHTYEFVVDVRERIVTEVKAVPSVQPMVTQQDFDSAEAVVRRFPRFAEAMKRRGLIPEKVAVETWASGNPVGASQRLVRAIFYVADSTGRNRYDQPIEGVSALINLQSKAIIEWRDHDVAPIPKATSTYPVPHAQRDGPDQPPNTNITTRHDAVQWGSWKFTPMINAREGLTLYDVRFVDSGIARRIAHRISLSEMLVPYGDTSVLWVWRNAFDVGEYGFGQNSTRLRRGSDVPDNAVLRSASFVEDDGDVITKPDVLAMYERDAGMLWRHVDYDGSVSSRRGKELVIQHAAVIGNYDYIVSYVLSQDGTITIDVGLTGIMLVKGSVDSVADYSGSGAQMYAHLVAPHVLAPCHQHFFNFRIDLDVDDTANVVTEIDVRVPPNGDENIFSNAMMVDEWDIRSEREGKLDVSLKNSRTWRITSKKRNTLGGYTGYTIVPQSVAFLYLGPTTSVRKRATFTEHQLHVTRFNANELYAAGAYPNESEVDLGLPVYQANDDRLIRRDVVLWYTMGVTHVARPEDWPVMPTSHATVRIIPTGFFVRNPLLPTTQSTTPTPKKTKKR